jgi:hypothetical protein
MAWWKCNLTSPSQESRVGLALLLSLHNIQAINAAIAESRSERHMKSYETLVAWTLPGR